MPMGPKDLIFTEEAVVLMDLAKILTWKTAYEMAAESVRADGRGMITLEDVMTVLGPAMQRAIEQVRITADGLVKDRELV